MENKKYVGKKELWMYALGAGGQGMIYAMMSSYITDYYVNVLQLPLAFILALMMGARVWDAINDPMMGMIVDRHTTKWGKMKPYIIFATPVISILTLLMYCSPKLDMVPLMIFSAVVYILWGMSYTVADVPFWGIPNVMTPDAKERGGVISFTKIINSIGSALPEVFFLIVPLVLTLFISEDTNPIAFNKSKYLVIAIAAVVLGGILYVNSYFHIKERVVLPDKKKKPGEPSSLSRIFKCKPLMLVVLMGVLSSGRYMVQAAAVHVARYAFYIGPELTETMSLAERTAAIESSVSLVKTIFQVCAIVGMFGTTLFMPYLMKKFDYKKIVITTCLLGFVASLFTTFIGWQFNNLLICTPFILIQCIPLGVINVLCYAMICDCLDYMELNTGYRENGLGAACQGFINKIGNAFANAGIIVMYMVMEMDPSAMLSSEAIKSALDIAAEQRFAMFSLVSLVPGVSMLLCALPMFFYKISGKEKEKMLQDLKAKREAEGLVIAE
ncbi:MAG: MFS transporter [Clostridia bacterium]|nr:MFS transporter [Clostridia bacterium]